MSVSRTWGVSSECTSHLGRDPPGQTTFVPAHAPGKGKSFFFALELKLNVRDYDIQPKQPSWVPSEWWNQQGHPGRDHEVWPQLRMRARGIRWR